MRRKVCTIAQIEKTLQEGGMIALTTLSEFRSSLIDKNGRVVGTIRDNTYYDHFMKRCERAYSTCTFEYYKLIDQNKK